MIIRTRNRYRSDETSDFTVPSYVKNLTIDDKLDLAMNVIALLIEKGTFTEAELQDLFNDSNLEMRNDDHSERQ